MAGGRFPVLTLVQAGRMEMGPMPLLVLTSDLLTLGPTQLDERISREVAENPAIRVHRRCCRCGQATRAGVCRRCRHQRPTGEELPDASSSTRTALVADVLCGASAAHPGAVLAIVTSLDGHGLLTHTSPTELRAIARCSANELDHALEAVRRAGPAGLACFDARACLLAKIDEAPCGTDAGTARTWALARRLVADHLPAVADGGIEETARVLGVPAGDVEAALALLRHRLTPYPDIDLDQEPARPEAPPDIVFRLRDGEVSVEVNDAWTGAISISQEFLGTGGRGAGREVRDFVTEHVARARLLLAALDHRRATIERVASAVAAHHRDCLVSGSTAFGPLRRREIAVALGLHESSVSRVVKDRVVRLPDGTLTAFAALFGPGNDIRMALHALMATEPRCSDQRLADLLAAQGIVIARRTVAKYRSESGVPVTARRRGLAGSAAT